MGSDDLFKKRKLRALQSRQRRELTRSGKENILIVCEGKTERLYFDSFPLKTANVTPIGTGRSTKSLITKARAEQNAAHRKEEDFDQVWCVFDQDCFGKEKFNTAIQMAESSHFKTVWSNECFELWFVLHFQPMTAGLTRDQYCDLLDWLLGETYEKTDSTMYRKLSNRQNVAIRNAQRLYSSYTPDINPADRNPCSTVYRLVEELKKFCQ
ncbi:RloB family protein [bacterium]|nr:RloB family protein [bacterium]MBU1635523.1 RloB family protein [bacterium]MBU1874149.1 RloB family protein [bacterium]